MSDLIEVYGKVWVTGTKNVVTLSCTLAEQCERASYDSNFLEVHCKKSMRALAKHRGIRATFSRQAPTNFN